MVVRTLEEGMKIPFLPNLNSNTRLSRPFKSAVTSWKCSPFLFFVRTLPSASSIAIASSSITQTVR